MSDFYTVSQFANIYGKDPGNVRRLLINGQLKGEKVGNQWLIPKNTEYPTDKRIKTGAYRNWRKSTGFRSRHPELMRNLKSMCNNLQDAYGDTLTKVILYGSYARGQETSESDVDIALVLKEPQNNLQHEKMTDIVVDYELDLGVTLSVITIEQSEYLEWHTILPFYKNIDKEGLTIWKNA